MIKVTQEQVDKIIEVFNYLIANHTLWVGKSVKFSKEEIEEMKKICYDLGDADVYGEQLSARENDLRTNGNGVHTCKV